MVPIKPAPVDRLDLVAVGLLTLVWIGIIALVNPVGDFPLNDDWAYAKGVQSLLAQGDLRLTDWAPASQIAQTLWGALFCVPFGFSFTALRFSTLVLGWVGIAATYGLARQMGADRTLAFLAALVVLANPIYLNLAFTFMTDVPFYAFWAVSSYCFVRGLQKDSAPAVVAGTVFACAAALTRQFGVVLPIAFSLAYLAKNGIKRKALAKAGMSVLVVVASLALYQMWLAATGRLPQTYTEQANELKLLLSGEGLARTLRSLGQTALYTGTLAFPWLILPFAAIWRVRPRQRLSALSIGLGFTATLLSIVSVGRALPDALIPRMVQGVLFDFGAGFPILKDVLGLWWLNHLPRAPVEFWLAVTALGAAGAVLIVYCSVVAVGRAFRLQRLEWPVVFAASGSLVYFLLIATRTAFYDRYLLVLLPMVIILVLSQMAALRPTRVSSVLTAAAFALALAYGSFAVAGVHDYLAWNRVRWAALRQAMAEGRLAADNTDGGFEFNGWFLYDSRYRARPDRSWWWVKQDDYVVSFGPIDGYEEYERHPFERWMPIGVTSVLILKRKSPQNRPSKLEKAAAGALSSASTVFC